MGRTHSTSNLRRRFGVAVVVGALALAGCGADADDAASVEDAAEDTADGGFGEFEEPAPDVADDAEAPRAGGAAAEGVPVDFGRDIITEVGLTMTTSDVAQAADDVRRLTVENGGAVFESDVTIGDVREDGSVPGGGRIVVRIPPQDLDRLVTELDGLGGVTRLSQDSEDVTDQLVDLEIRIRQAQSGIDRIEEILAQTTELDDLFAIETELGRRQVELERLLAAQRATEDRVSLATLTVDIEYRAPAAAGVEPDEGDDGIADAFRSGWDAFIGVVFALGFVIAISAPFLATAIVVAAAIWAVTTLLRRRRTTDAGASRRAPAAGVVSEPDDEPSRTG